MKLLSPIIERDFSAHVLSNSSEKYGTFLDGLWSRLLMSGPEVITIEDSWDQLRDCFDIVKGRSSGKAENRKILLTKDIEDACKHAKLTHEQALAVYSKQFKGMCRRFSKYGFKAAECTYKKNDPDISSGVLNQCFKCRTWGHRTNFAIRLFAGKLKSQLKQQIRCLKMKNQVVHWQ